MIYETLFLVLIDMVSSHLLVHSPSRCNYMESVGISQMVSFANPNWPGTYTPGESCQWIFNCHEGYICRLRCRDLGLPESEDCYMDQLLVSRKGDIRLDAEVFCGPRKINVRSNDTRIMIALKSSPTSPGGRFRCTVRTESKMSAIRLRKNTLDLIAQVIG